MRRSAYFGAALIGLLVVAAISVAAGSGRKPALGGPANVDVRPLSASEVMDILSGFPEMVPSDLADQRNDTSYLVGVFGFAELTVPLLERIFPATRFYIGRDFHRKPSGSYVMAIAGNRRYMMPTEFNKLLAASGLKVTDKNMVELAEAFVICAIGSEQYSSFPEIAFLVVARATLKADLPTENALILKVKTGGRTEKWHFSVSRGQFEGAARVSEKGLIKNYPSVIVESLPARGQLTPTPALTIGIYPDSGDAYLEHDTLNNAHYYIIVEMNDDSTGNEVVFYLDSFPPESTNVCVRVRDSIRHATRWLDTVQMSSGSGSDTWQPRVESTGICLASAGYDVGGTYVRVTNNIELTPERLKAGTFPGNSNETLRVYFCDQFFESLPGGAAHAVVFAQCVENAMHESWRTQVDTWRLGAPYDTNHKHQVFINDSVNWFHGDAGTAADGGPDRKIYIEASLWHRSKVDSAYSDEPIRIKSCVSHEFHHGIQWTLSYPKFNRDDWNWFTEGQARFLQSAQYPSEEFDTSSTWGKRQYARDANKYLTQCLNTSLSTLSNYPITGYPYCLFWRFMYENFGRDSGGVQLVKDCYAVNVGTGNSIGRGKAAIDSAIRTYVPGGIPTPGWSNFLQVLDQFAVACYLNDPAFNKWNPNPSGVYSTPDLALDTAFRLGPDETDSYIKDESIPHSFGIDLMQVALNGRVPAEGIDKQSAGSRLATPAERA